LGTAPFVASGLIRAVRVFFFFLLADPFIATREVDEADFEALFFFRFAFTFAKRLPPSLKHLDGSRPG
jgi:hypothetical protein